MPHLGVILQFTTTSTLLTTPGLQPTANDVDKALAAVNYCFTCHRDLNPETDRYYECAYCGALTCSSCRDICGCGKG